MAYIDLKLFFMGERANVITENTFSDLPHVVILYLYIFSFWRGGLFYVFNKSVASGEMTGNEGRERERERAMKMISPPAPSLNPAQGHCGSSAAEQLRSPGLPKPEISDTTPAQ